MKTGGLERVFVCWYYDTQQIGKRRTGLVEAPPRKQHALDAVARVPQLDLLEVALVGGDGVVGRLIIHKRVFSQCPAWRPRRSRNHSTRPRPLHAFELMTSFFSAKKMLIQEILNINF